jgi:LysM repeat protein
MSAMRAEELPEVPAASPQDSAQTQAAARWTGPDRTASAATAPDHAAHAQPAPRSSAYPQPAPRLSARPEPARARAAAMPLRLTRRGRVVVAVAAALLLAALSLVIAASAQATNHPAPRTAQQSLARVIVRPGQSLWSVAENADPHADTRVVIHQIIELNGLTGDVVFAGQRLWVPRS